MRILLVEDDQKLSALLQKGLQEERHTVELARTGSEGIDFTERAAFDVIVLDVMLPGIDGFEVARRLRRGGCRTPVLMLTARDATTDIVQGLDVGADDYLIKPFSFDELLARIRALGRRGPAESMPVLQAADLTLDPASHRVVRGGRRVRLSRTEYRLLELLLRHKGRVLSRSAIIDAVWGVDGTTSDNTLEAFIRLLRRKVDDGARTRLIHTERGFGYVLREEEPS